MKEPCVTVIMAAYNTEKYIGEAIESVLAQTCSDWELIIVDDASTDRTASVIAAYKQKDRRITSIRLEKNSGQTAARSKAAEAARGSFIAILDSDDVCMPDRLERQISFLRSHEDVSIVGSSAEIISADGQQLKFRRKPSVHNEIQFRLLLTTQFIHSTVCMRKKDYFTLGGYDSRFVVAEDYDLWCRAANAGMKLANIPDVLVKFRIQPRSVTHTFEARRRDSFGYDVNERNLKPYLDLSRAHVERLVDFANSRPQTFMEKLAALRDYRRLCLAYIRVHADTLKAAEKTYVLQQYKNERKHLLVSMVKKAFKSR